MKKTNKPNVQWMAPLLVMTLGVPTTAVPNESLSPNATIADLKGKKFRITEDISILPNPDYDLTHSTYIENGKVMPGEPTRRLKFFEATPAHRRRSIFESTGKNEYMDRNPWGLNKKLSATIPGYCRVKPYRELEPGPYTVGFELASKNIPKGGLKIISAPVPPALNLIPAQEILITDVRYPKRDVNWKSETRDSAGETVRWTLSELGRESGFLQSQFEVRSSDLYSELREKAYAQFWKEQGRRGIYKVTSNEGIQGEVEFFDVSARGSVGISVYATLKRKSEKELVSRMQSLKSEIDGHSIRISSDRDPTYMEYPEHTIVLEFAWQDDQSRPQWGLFICNIQNGDNADKLDKESKDKIWSGDIPESLYWGGTGRERFKSLLPALPAKNVLSILGNLVTPL